MNFDLNPDLAAALDAAPQLAAAPAALQMLNAEAWAILTRGDAALGFCGLWVAGTRAYTLFEYKSALLFVATDLVANAYPSLAAGFPLAAWFERLAHDLTGAVATGATDCRPAIAQGAAGTDAAWPRFLETRCEGGYQIGEGPASGVIAAPMHQRFSLDGGRILRLEHRLGYAHRGVTGLMGGKSPRVAARFAARITGDATVAHAVAFARAAEAACGLSAPARAEALRGAMLAIERITGDLASLAATAGVAGHARLAAMLGRAREQIATALGETFGHRLMMDIVVPGGLALDFRPEGMPALRRGLDQARHAVRGIGRERVRHDLGAAVALTLARARAVLALVAEVPGAIEAAPAGIIAQALPAVSGMGLGAAVSARGMVHHWLDVEGGQIRDSFAIDPSARLLPALEAAAVGLDFHDAAVLAACYGLSVGAIDG
ncbi:MAG: nickel-dependent hydrogenase large subunit [Acidiphilium sp.]|nr:nickel-dependent hydrogenase large subunit [Acidiphilium sp.]MDD4934421.1 nickel-dependent hydrogenase large subunit [Acidiphilium sp.]